MPVGRPGTFDIRIHFTQDSIMRMRDLAGKFVALQDFRPFWTQSGIVQDIKDEITKNLDQGVDPDLAAWAPLSLLYSRRTGRTRMVVSQGSPIRFAYVHSPFIDARATRLIYSANPAYTELHHLALRSGWTSRGGGQVPGREWFGISASLEQKFQRRLDEWMFKQLARPGILGGVR